MGCGPRPPDANLLKQHGGRNLEKLSLPKGILVADITLKPMKRSSDFT